MDLTIQYGTVLTEQIFDGSYNDVLNLYMQSGALKTSYCSSESFKDGEGTMWRTVTADNSGSKIKDVIKKHPHKNMVGCSAYYHKPSGFVQVWSVMANNDTGAGVTQVVTWGKDEENAITKVSKITCCGNDSPTWTATKIVHDHTSSNEVYYLVGDPKPANGRGDIKVGSATSRNKVMIWRVDGDPAENCAYVQSFLIDFRVQGNRLLDSEFWFKLLDLNIDEDGMTA
jgi:hypothetical protein